MFTEGPGIYTYAQLLDRLFTNPGRNDHINDTPLRCAANSWPYWAWQQEWWHMAQVIGPAPCRITLTLESVLIKHSQNYDEEVQEVADRKASRGDIAIKRWRTKQGVVRRKEDCQRAEPTPISMDPTFEGNYMLEKDT